MTFYSLVSLFFAMILLAALPSTSVLTVVARSLSAGFWHGSVTALGIVVGDIAFILLVIFGLSAVATTFSGLFMLMKVAGGVYLMVLGVTLWRVKVTESDAIAKRVTPIQEARQKSLQTPSWLSSFLSGLLITLGDQKAILFYVGFLPAFIDLSTFTATDVIALILTAIVAVGSVKVLYAYLAGRAIAFFQSSSANRLINRVSGTAMIATGLSLVGTTVFSSVTQN